MASNSQTMTVEERLVQKLKGEALLSLIEDEDALTELARRAVNEALFKDRLVERGGYGQSDRYSSPAVEAARAVAEKAADAIMQKEVKRLSDDPEFIKRVREAFALALPTIIDRIATSGIHAMLSSAQVSTINEIQGMVRNGMIRP
jgi:hypothetical protein